MKVNVYNADGSVNLDLSFMLKEDVEHINGRVSRGEKLYYKGVGIPYDHHYTHHPTVYETVINESPVFYMGKKVWHRNFAGKTGIFLHPYQPQFTDVIGACGAKELAIIENSQEFGMSAVEVIGSVNITKDIYYFILKYLDGRGRWDGYPKDLYKLLDYMVRTDWNFIWDKNILPDISLMGRINDVADIFHSKSLESKFGTVYAAFYSLQHNHEYNAVFKEHYKWWYKGDPVWDSVRFLALCGINTSPFYEYDGGHIPKNRNNVIRKYLVTGRNCGHCCHVDYGEKVKASYLEQTEWMNA